MKFNSFLSLILIIFVSVLFSGYFFPEQLPTWNGLYTYNMTQLDFGNTDIATFKAIAPEIVDQQLAGKYTIFKELNPSPFYKSVRIGFNNNLLEWVEFQLNSPLPFSQFKNIYGPPKQINKNYSNKYNYADYSFFSLLLDKNNSVVMAINMFDTYGYNSSYDRAIKILPNFTEFNDIRFFVPGKLTEDDFLAVYPDFKPVSAATSSDVNLYKIDPKFLLSNPYYSNICIAFKNGLLNFVSLNPKNLTLDKIQKTYGTKPVKQSNIPNIAFYDYDNFTVTVYKSTKKIKSIGIFGVNPSPMALSLLRKY